MAKKMPINIKKLLESVSVIGQERDLPVYVSIIYDATAPDELIDCVLKAFATDNVNAHVVEDVLVETVPDVSYTADLCIVVAGDSLAVGDAAQRARGKGVPTLVVAYEGTSKIAPDGVSTSSTRRDSEQAGLVVTGIPSQDYIEIDPHDRTGRPLEELGMWIISKVVDKRMALSTSFEFLRHPMAGELAISNSIQNGAIGTVFFMPGADMPLITLNQAKMVLEIASVYGQPLNTERAKELAVVIAGAYGMRGIARQLARQIPGPLGIPVKAGIAFAGTMAMGYAAIDYFEEGGVVATAAETAKTAYKWFDEHARAGVDIAAEAGERIRTLLNGVGGVSRNATV